MALSSFAAGYFVNDLVARTRVPGVALASADPDIHLYWEAWQHVENSFFGDTPATKQRTYGAIRGSFELLDDPYTVFVEPQVREQERENLRGNFGGIGVNLQRDPSGAVVLTPIPGNPAAAAGVRDGDILRAIDGQPVDPALTVEAIADLLRGEKGTDVVLTVLHPGESSPVDIAVERADILIPSVWHRVLDEAPTVGYIQLSRFSGESAAEVAAAADSLRKAGVTAIVLDLRHNGGGLLDAAIDVADHFLADGLIMLQDARGEERRFEADRETVAEGLHLVVLVDQATASAAEIVAGALQDRGRATLIGARTFGKGSVQLIYDLSDGSSVHVTSARWLTPSGRRLDGVGLEPDLLVEPTQAARDVGRDEPLERAVRFLLTGE